MLKEILEKIKGLPLYQEGTVLEIPVGNTTIYEEKTRRTKPLCGQPYVEFYRKVLGKLTEIGRHRTNG
jgi:hypothetical protein